MGTQGNGGGLRRRRFLALAVAAVLIAVGGPPAIAQSLDGLRASGAVGEGFDGFARARDASAQSAVSSVNAKRRAIYEKRARSQGVSVDQVGRIYAKEILSKAPPGTWFLNEAGRWTQK